jgi:Domain of unknown function (DU1801)
MPKTRFTDKTVEAVFRAYPKPVGAKLLILRQLIFDVARQTPGVGKLQEALRWGQPSYLTPDTGSGSTIRIDKIKNESTKYAMYFHCQSGLVESFRELYSGEFKFAGNRSLVFDVADELPLEALRHCISLALTYHQRRSLRTRVTRK